MWQPIGVVVCCAIAYGTVPKYACDVNLKACAAVAAGEPCCTTRSNMGWRYLMIILGAITLTIFFVRFVVFRFQESPKYLLGKGREQEAIDVLHRIAKFNRTAPPTLTIERFAELDQEQSIISDPTSTTPLSTSANAKRVIRQGFNNVKHLKGLFLTPIGSMITIIIWIAYIGDFWSFNLAGSFLPIILKQNNVSSGQGTVTDTYRQYVYIYLPGVIGAIMAMGAVQLPVLGRKWSLVLGAAIQGLSMAMYTQVKTTAGYVGLNALEYIMQTVSSWKDVVRG